MDSSHWNGAEELMLKWDEFASSEAASAQNPLTRNLGVPKRRGLRWEDAEELMLGWEDFVSRETANAQNLLMYEFDAPKFRELAFGAWRLFRDCPLGDTRRCQALKEAPYGTYCFHLSVFSSIRAFADSGNSVLDAYLRGGGSFESMPDSSRWPMEFARNYVAAAIAAECLCQKLSSGEDPADPVCMCTLNTYGFSEDRWDGVHLPNMEIFGDGRSFDVVYNVKIGDFSQILGALEHLAPLEWVHSWQMDA